MNLLLLEESDFIDGNTARIAGDRLHHIHTVLAAKEGETLTAGMLNGKMGTAAITLLSPLSATLTVTLNLEPPKPLPLTVILALPRPKMLKRILRNTAEFGIKELYLINSYKVEKSYWHTPALQPETIHQYLKDGLSQAKDTILPCVHLKKRFKPFIEDELPAILAGKEAFVAHPYQAQAAPAPSSGQRVIAIGPEGGFIDYEIEQLRKQGMQVIHIGERIYRVENALSILSSRLSFSHPDGY